MEGCVRRLCWAYASRYKVVPAARPVCGTEVIRNTRPGPMRPSATSSRPSPTSEARTPTTARSTPDPASTGERTALLPLLVSHLSAPAGQSIYAPGGLVGDSPGATSEGGPSVPLEGDRAKMLLHEEAAKSTPEVAYWRRPTRLLVVGLRSRRPCAPGATMARSCSVCHFPGASPARQWLRAAPTPRYILQWSDTSASIRLRVRRTEPPLGDVRGAPLPASPLTARGVGQLGIAAPPPGGWQPGRGPAALSNTPTVFCLVSSHHSGETTNAPRHRADQRRVPRGGRLATLRRTH